MKKGTKRARQYEHIKKNLKQQGRSDDKAEEIAARTVNKERARHGESRSDKLAQLRPRTSPRAAGAACARAQGQRGRTRDQLYDEAQQLGVEAGRRWTRASCNGQWAADAVPLNHVALTVSDRNRSAAFYAEHFGLTERVHDDEHMLIIGSGDGSILALREGQPPADLPGTNHFGFQVATADEARAARERFRAAGVTETEWQEEGFVRVQVADPDGYRVELFAF